MHGYEELIRVRVIWPQHQNNYVLRRSTPLRASTWCVLLILFTKLGQLKTITISTQEHTQKLWIKQTSFINKMFTFLFWFKRNKFILHE